MHEFADEAAADSADKFTDENKSYTGLKHHKAVNHSVGEWNGILLGDDETRLSRYLSSHEQEAPQQVCARVCQTPQSSPTGYNGVNGRSCGRYVRKAAHV
ncbi:MAG: hypothetical protein OXC62_15305 [Aestuariivita sp.]|nr:hypothetical protein [Aestuariivita sp.]